MMAHAAGVAHARGGDYDLGRFVLVYGLRFGLADGEIKSREIQGIFARAYDGGHLLVDVARVALKENAGRLDGKRTVDINGEVAVTLHEPL